LAGLTTGAATDYPVAGKVDVGATEYKPVPGDRLL